MGVVVQFNYAAWAARYPDFAAVDPTLVSLYFNEATLYARNDGGGPVCDSGVQSTLLNMLTAHIWPDQRAARSGTDRVATRSAAYRALRKAACRSRRTIQAP